MAVSKFFGLLVSEMEAGAFAVAPVFAGLAFTGLSPVAVAHDLVAVLPNVPDIILVDVSLDIVATEARACRDAPVAKNR